jgi:hypothetical protein
MASRATFRKPFFRHQETNSEIHTRHGSNFLLIADGETKKVIIHDRPYVETTSVLPFVTFISHSTICDLLSATEQFVTCYQPLNNSSKLKVKAGARTNNKGPDVA